ncbi:hypothetical protein [Bradyrhizobium paxllaeri]|uniref:hypothetical protein n=1 Tax=Bradyrhizobium paxllaeri TaxID=190148 RepID=UPI0011463395|nr:hypothetical protein [Bradyrhizobium paxllaeri]
MSDQERERHEVNGCLELLFALRSEFAQWQGEARDGSAREVLENVLGHIEALEREYRAAPGRTAGAAGYPSSPTREHKTPPSI